MFDVTMFIIMLIIFFAYLGICIADYRTGYFKSIILIENHITITLERLLLLVLTAGGIVYFLWKIFKD